MKTISVRDLRYDFPRVESLLRSGEELKITKRRKVIARLVPEALTSTILPDFMAQMRAIYGNECSPVSGAEVVSMDRDRY